MVSRRPKTPHVRGAFPVAHYICHSVRRESRFVRYQRAVKFIGSLLVRPQLFVIYGERLGFRSKHS